MASELHLHSPGVDGCVPRLPRNAVVPSNKIKRAPAITAVNRLLESLPGDDRRRVVNGCETVELVSGDVLAVAGERIRHVYFPTNSLISLITPAGASAAFAVGLVGNEGMFGIPLVLGVNVSRVQALVQGAGSALRMNAATFCRELGRSPALQRGLDRYIFVQLSQLAQAAACTRFHVVEARLACWLLMTQDRARAGAFHITHEFLAFMLGVRRVGVTRAATALQKRRLIRYSRGNITVLDRRGLMAASCGCYQADRMSYDRILS
jgi:CRP-like cAMP-binding protein